MRKRNSDSMATSRCSCDKIGLIDVVDCNEICPYGSHLHPDPPF